MAVNAPKTLTFTLFLFFLLAGSALAGSANVHPDIGDKTPNELLAKDVLALPERERQAWIHGAVSLMAQTAAAQQNGAGRCVMDWYFESKAASMQVIQVLERYPDRRASSVLISLARLHCENL